MKNDPESQITPRTVFGTFFDHFVHRLFRLFQFPCTREDGWLTDGEEVDSSENCQQVRAQPSARSQLISLHALHITDRMKGEEDDIVSITQAAHSFCRQELATNA